MCDLKSIPDGYFWQLLLEHFMEKIFFLIVNPTHTSVGNFGVKKFSLPVRFYEMFLRRKFIARKFATLIFVDLEHCRISRYYNKSTYCNSSLMIVIL